MPVLGEEVAADLLGDLLGLEDGAEVLGPKDGLELAALLLPVVGHDDEAGDAEEDDDGAEGEGQGEQVGAVLHLGRQDAHLDVQVLALEKERTRSFNHAL